MNISIYSREQAESMIAEDKFPKNVAVISFYDPAIKRIDKDYSHIDYSGVCKTVFYSELDDLDLEVLKEKGYTYDTYFPEADEMAKFIYNAYDSDMDIICQCEYGQSRSAGCAAAIFEHFYHNGISVFANYNYYPNQVVYHKIFDALKRQKRYHDNRYYFAADTEIIKSHLARMQLPKEILSDYNPSDGNSVADVKCEIERYLSARHLIFNSSEAIINCLLNSGQSIYASFTVTKLFHTYDRYLWEPYAVHTYFRYGLEEIPVVIWFSRYRSSNARKMVRGREIPQHECHLGFSPIQSLDFFGKLSWDGKRKMIDAVPLIITNIQP